MEGLGESQGAGHDAFSGDGDEPWRQGGDGQLIGSCEWVCLKLLGGTTVETTPLVRHYVPAAVVTVHTGGCPWTEARARSRR